MRLLLAEDEKALSKAIVKILEKNNSSVDDRVCEATVKGTDPDNDLAVIAVKKSDIPDETARVIQAAVIGSSDERFRKKMPPGWGSTGRTSLQRSPPLTGFPRAST